MSNAPHTLRLATPSDVPALEALIPRSVRGLSATVYSAAQIESAIRYVFGVDTQLVADGTYFVVEAGAVVVGCGGWSKRRTLYGADKMKQGPDPLLDPARDAAKIRAFFVDPDCARQGVGSRIIERAIADARAAGFTRLELMATLPGVPLYERHGFARQEPVVDVLPDGTAIPLVRMGRAI